MKTVFFFIIGFALGFVVSHFIIGYGNLHTELFFGAALGLGYSIAYFVDKPHWSLGKRLLISSTGIIAIQIVGLLLFSSDDTVLALIKYCVVLMTYNIVATLTKQKTLR